MMKKIFPIINIIFYFLILAGCGFSNIANLTPSSLTIRSYGEEVIFLETRKGVTVPVLISPSGRQGNIALIMLTGSDGNHFGVLSDGTIIKTVNFLTRTTKQFASKGIMVTVMNPPSDQFLAKMSNNYRSSKEHVIDVAKIADYLVSKGFDSIYLIGTSQGTYSVSYLGAELKHKNIKGIIMTATVEIARWNPIDKIEYPALLVHHKNDGCKFSLHSDALSLSKRLVQSPSVNFVTVEGGKEPESEPCSALCPHGFFGIEDNVIDEISKWIIEIQTIYQKKQ
jgi:hypothetical protein